MKPYLKIISIIGSLTAFAFTVRSIYRRRAHHSRTWFSKVCGSSFSSPRGRIIGITAKR